MTTSAASAAPRRILIGGRWVEAAAGATREIRNPANGRLIATVPECGREDVERAVEAACAARSTWADATPGERGDVLLALAAALDAGVEELAAIESENAGKPLTAAREEVVACADAARNLEGKAAGEYVRGYTSMIRREPIGLVAGIAPWNYPLMMAAWKLGPALAAGNVQILKPAEQTPCSLLRFMELAADAIPAGVLNVVTGD